jgi:hypothetical protein
MCYPVFESGTFAVQELRYPLMCVHTIPSTFWVSIFYVVLMATNAQEPMMQFITPLLLFCEKLAPMWDKNNYMHFLQSHLTLLVDNLTLCLPKMTFAL